MEPARMNEEKDRGKKKGSPRIDSPHSLNITRGCYFHYFRLTTSTASITAALSYSIQLSKQLDDTVTLQRPETTVATCHIHYHTPHWYDAHTMPVHTVPGVVRT